jgi:hypothetical protein
MPISTIGTAGLEAAGVSQTKLATGVAGTGPLLITGSSTAVSVPTATSTVFTSYSASVVDTASAFSTTTGRFTPQVAGYYLVNAWTGWDVNGINAVVISTTILKNNSSYAYSGIGSGSAIYPKVEASSIVQMNGTTDYITVAAFQIAGGTASGIYALLQAVLIRVA